MRKKIIIIIAILLIPFLLIRPILFKTYNNAFSRHTDLSKENVEGVYLYEDINSENIVSKYGEISIPSADNTMYNYYYLREGIEIATDIGDSKILRFVVNDENVRTEKGVKVGAHKEDIIKLYGENYYTRVEQGTNIIGYTDKKMDIYIEFWMGEKGVIFYRLNDKSMI